MPLHNSRRRNVLLLGLLLAPQVLFLLPVLLSVLTYRLKLTFLIDAITPLSKTLSFAAVSTTIIVIVGFFGAQSLKNIKNPWILRLLPFLLIPTLVGSASTAVIFRSLQQTIEGLEARPAIAVWSFLLLLHLWQYVPLSIFLFYAQLQLIPDSLKDFSVGNKLTYQTRLAHIYWPSSRNLAILVGLFAFMFGFAEAEKATILFHPSKATDTQFLSHWLDEIYRTRQAYDHEAARSMILSLSAAVVPAVVLSASLLVGFLTLGIGKLLRINARFFNICNVRFSVFPSRLSDLTLLLILAISITPFLIFFLESSGSPQRAGLTEFLEAGKFSFVAAVVITCTCVLSTFLMRLEWPDTLSTFTGRSLFLLCCLFILRGIPPIGLSFSAFEWHAIFGRGSQLFMRSLWVVGELVIFYPYIASFVFFLHLRVRTEEIFYCKASGVTRFEILKFIFFKKLWREYLLVLIFSFCFSLTDTTISSTMSSYVTSFGCELSKSARGRGADVGEAATLVFALFTLAIGSAILLSSIHQFRKLIGRKYAVRQS